MIAAPDSSLVEIGHAGFALDRVISGDLPVVAASPTGVLLAVIDGLGHGPEAAEAARDAARVLVANAGEPVIPLVERCHEALRKTRGVVLSLAALRPADSSITWLGVGNVEGLLVRADRRATPARESIQLRGGVVGYQLPPLRATTLAIACGDIVIMVSDGIRSEFAVGLALERGAQDLAATILHRHARGTDDALVLVVRYLGGTT